MRRVLILIMLAIMSPAHAAEPSPDQRLVWREAPSAPRALTLDSADGTLKDLADLRGGWAVVNIWATWCAPCVQELPGLARLREALANSGVAVVAVSVDRGGLRVIGPFLERVGAAGLPAIAARGPDVLALVNGDRRLPVTFILDPDGREVARGFGAADWTDAGFAAKMRALAAAERGDRR